MAVKVMVPSPLRSLTRGAVEVEVEGDTIQEVIKNLDQAYKGLGERLCDEQGKIRRFVNVYVNEEDVRFLQGETTKVKPGDTISIIPAIAGGSRHEDARFCCSFLIEG